MKVNKKITTAIKFVAIWLCVLLALVLLDDLVLSRITVSEEGWDTYAPYRLIPPYSSPIKDITGTVPLEECIQTLGLPTGFFSGSGTSSYVWDMQWGGQLHGVMFKDSETIMCMPIYYPAPFSSARWLFLPAIMFAVGTIEVIVYQIWKKKKRKATNTTESPEPQPVDTPQQA